MRMGPLPLMHEQDKHPVVHAAICPLAEAVCFLWILVSRCFVLFFFSFFGLFVACFVLFDCFVYWHDIYLVGLVAPFSSFAFNFPFVFFFLLLLLFLRSMSVISACSLPCVFCMMSW